MTTYTLHHLDKAGALSKTSNIFTGLADYIPKYSVLAESLRSEMMSLRSGNAHTKTRGEVRGGGKKPWKQKGTGRARHGSIRSPIWVGGGITFGPRNDKNWFRKINKSARLTSLKTLFVDRALSDKLIGLAQVDMSKTAVTLPVITKLSASIGIKPKNIALIYTSSEIDAIKGFANLEVNMINAINMKLSELANSKAYILTESALALLEERFVATSNFGATPVVEAEPAKAVTKKVAKVSTPKTTSVKPVKVTAKKATTKKVTA